MLDLLDRIVFRMEWSELAGREFSEDDIDLVKAGILHVDHITDYLTGRKDIIKFSKTVLLIFASGEP